MNPRVVPSVAGDLMARVRDPAHQFWVPLRDPAEREERRLDVDFGKQVEDTEHVVVHPQRQRVPIISGNYVLERTDLEPILDVDRQAIEDAPTGSAFRTGTHRHATTPVRLPHAALRSRTIR